MQRLSGRQLLSPNELMEHKLLKEPTIVKSQ